MILLGWCSALLFPVLLLLGGPAPDWSLWWQPVVIGLLFMLGQLLTFLAVKWGDVSIAAPVLGVKVLLVPTVSILLVGDMPELRIWQAAGLATLGVIFVQRSDSHVDRSRVLQSVGLAASAALTMTIFDLLIQRWNEHWSAGWFLTLAFAATAVIGCCFLPLADSPRRLLADRKLWVPLLIGSILMAVQAMGMTATLAIWGDASRVNIVYSLRGVWGVALTWLLLHRIASRGEEEPLATSNKVMLTRMVGAVLIAAAVVRTVI